MIAGENPNVGIGDEIMASGHARKAHLKTGKRVVITDRLGRARWSGMWEGVPFIVRPGEPRTPAMVEVRNGAQCRPYIRYPFSRVRGQRWTNWRAQDHVGVIVLSDDEKRWAAAAAAQLGNFCILEPNVKPGSNPNKKWPTAKWQALAELVRAEGFDPITIGPPGQTMLPNCAFVESPSIRHGAALLGYARWLFLPDGALHHAAAALDIRATVLWGGATDPNVLGYPLHENIYFPKACGRWLPCKHCAQIWAALTPEEVMRRTKAVW